MTEPQREARALILSFLCVFETTLIGYDKAKKCALIAVELIIKVIPMYTGELNPHWKYWQDVKTEINTL